MNRKNTKLSNLHNLQLFERPGLFAAGILMTAICGHNIRPQNTIIRFLVLFHQNLIKIFLFLILTNSDFFFLSNIQEFFKYIIKAYLERSKTVPFIIVKGVFYLNFWFGYIIILLPLPHLGGFVFLLAVYPGSSSGESRSW